MKSDALITHKKDFFFFLWATYLNLSLVLSVILFSVEFWWTWISFYILPSLCFSHVFPSVLYIYVLFFSGSFHWK